MQTSAEAAALAQRPSLEHMSMPMKMGTHPHEIEQVCFCALAHLSWLGAHASCEQPPPKSYTSAEATALGQRPSLEQMSMPVKVGTHLHAIKQVSSCLHSRMTASHESHAACVHEVQPVARPRDAFRAYGMAP